MVIAVVLVVVTILILLINVASIPVIYFMVLRILASGVRSFVSWVVYLFDNRRVELPDVRSASAEPVVSRAPPVRRDPAVRATAARVMARRRRRSRLLFGLLVLGIALLAPVCVGFNVWLDVLAERRTIRVSHTISDGTENLPEFLTVEMTIVAEEPGNSGSQCSVTLSWIDSGTDRIQKRVINNPDRIDIRDVLFSEGIRESPHYDHYPVALTTKGCKAWHLERSN